VELTLRPLWKFPTDAMISWHQAKLFFEHSVTISHGTLHVIVGVLIWLALALFMRRSVTSWFPWLWLFAIILCNETVDLWIEKWPDPGQQYGEGFKDLLLTMLVPTLIMFAARARPDLFRAGLGPRRRKRRQARR
jgi:hypothetical protein